jgi:YrbI family 3-deoxy-D-manno-octulosonate 8-phosphate phosphatase
VLTDGGVLFDNQGIEIKKFHIRDGLGIKLWQKAGFKFGLLTARTSHIVRVRAAELNVEIVRQGFENKLPTAKELMAQLGLEPEQVCHVGDDLTDLALMRHVGLGVAVADAVKEVRDAAQYVTKVPGGHGAVREVVELLLKTKNRWEDLIRNYTL